MPSWLRSRLPRFSLLSILVWAAVATAQAPPDTTLTPVPPPLARPDTVAATPAKPDSVISPPATPDSSRLLIPPADTTLARDTTRTTSKVDSVPGTTARRDSTPPSPVQGIRGKISAGDLLSAESILEWHRQRHGEGGAYVSGLGWVARGAVLLDDLTKAQRYANETRALCRERLARGADLEKDPDLATALGAAIEVEAQIRARERGKFAAVKYVRGELASINGPVSLRSRLYKRINLMSLQGNPAPEIAIEDSIATSAPRLASLRGKPVMLFLWAEWCADCKAQAAGVARVRKRYADRGLEVLALTRYYDPAEKRVTEKARVDSVWKAVYAEVGDIPIVFSTASMERYGGSATPTYVFVDKSGIVRGYTPTRLTEEEFDRRIEAILD